MEPIWNPWHGCRKCSEGCENCYMYYLDAARGRDGGEIYRVKTDFNLPLRRDRQGNYKIPSGSTLLVCLTSDFFLEEADEWRDEVWEMMRIRSDVTFRLQTKRIHRVSDCLPDDWGDGWENVALCVTAENRARADERIPVLLSLPFRSKSVMCAPILSAIDLSPYLATGQLREVLADGENYDGMRPCHYEWIAALSADCRRFGVPFTFCGTGNRFVRDGREYLIPKAYHQVEALRSGLSYPPPASVPPVQPRCRTCPRRDACNGCRQCGKCTKRPFVCR